MGRWSELCELLLLPRRGASSSIEIEAARGERRAARAREGGCGHHLTS